MCVTVNSCTNEAEQEKEKIIVKTGKTKIA